jgi:hypothetical protein
MMGGTPGPTPVKQNLGKSGHRGVVNGAGSAGELQQSGPRPFRSRFLCNQIGRQIEV